ncbi:MAG: hypothetical protein HYT89_06770 [Candidatus Omnitrophica bacterium]|nr:hypothetical protein [Candidatus Omnitrophota bacterium]
MELIVEANILLAALLKEAITRELLLDSRLKLYAPEHLISETLHLLKKNKKIQRRIGLTPKALEETFYLITQDIETHPRKTYASSLAEAKKIAPHSEDAPYLALALALNIPVWSNDQGIHAQSKVKVYTTKALLTALGTRRVS